MKTNEIPDNKRQQTTTVDYKRLINGLVLTEFAILQTEKQTLSIMNIQSNTPKEIPTGINKEDIETRKQIILDFYREWKQLNPTQRKYNVSLKDYVNIRNVSINETSFRASKTYLSTLAVLQLDAILTTARKTKVVNAKPNNKNQKPFNKMILMECELPGIGIVKLVVGIKRKTLEKVQYCITAIET